MIKNKFFSVKDNYYHIFNRGVAKQPIFQDKGDYARLLKTFAYYLDDKNLGRLSNIEDDKFKNIFSSLPEHPLVEIVCYCLMPNHFHLLIKQIDDSGMIKFIKKSLNSYVRYYNIKHKRIGPLFQGTFKSVLVNSNEQLIHLSRYIYLNPYVARIVDDPKKYQWSSINDILKNVKPNRLNNPQILLDIVGSSKKYSDFVYDYADYARTISDQHKINIDQD